MGALLVGGQIITAEQCEWLVNDGELTLELIEDAVVYRGLVNELDLLKFLASHHRTRFVSTERLSKAEIDRATLAMIPREVAETFCVFPVAFEPVQRALSVVTANPDDSHVLKEIQSSSAAREIKAFVARPAAVRAAVAKHYAGDTHAFALLTHVVAYAQQSMRVAERDGLGNTRSKPAPGSLNLKAAPRSRDSDIMLLELDDEPAAPERAAPSLAASLPPPLPARAAGSGRAAPTLPKASSSPAPSVAAGALATPTPPRAPLRAPNEVTTEAKTPTTPAGAMPTAAATGSPAAELPREPAGPPVAGRPAAEPNRPNLSLGIRRASSAELRAVSSLPPPSARATLPPGMTGGPALRVDPEAVGELVNVLVALLDSSRQDLRGHSSLVARLVRRLCERLNLPAGQVATFTLAAQLHDVGKAGPVHHTPINVGEYETCRAAAEKALMTPTRLLGSANVPLEALEAIEQMYERHDGHGIPNSLAGKEISLGARIIAIADAYADLVENGSNMFRRQMPPPDACAALMNYQGTVFDPHLLDLFKSLVLGDDMRAKLLSDRHCILLVDPDAEETTVLELRLIEQGFEVRTVRTLEHALGAMAEAEFDLVISELDLGKSDGLSLLKQARAQPWGKDLSWVVYTRRMVRDDAQKAFALGVLDFVAKPAQPDVLVAKLKAMLEQRANKKTVTGVSGSLREMGLPDLLQVLSQGRKTGNLRIRGGGGGSGEVHFEAGAVVDAIWGKVSGTNAFYSMVKIVDGEFGFDPTFKPGKRNIHDSTEGLLLEGLRRLDEGI